MSTRAGFEVVETMYITESTYGTTPTLAYTLANGDYNYLTVNASTAYLIADPYGVHNVIAVGASTVSRQAGSPTTAQLALELAEAQNS